MKIVLYPRVLSLNFRNVKLKTRGYILTALPCLMSFGLIFAVRV